MSDDLKPCPFCGCKNVYPEPPSLGRSAWTVACDDCRAHGPEIQGYNSDEVEARCQWVWNIRNENPAAAIASLQAELAEAREALMRLRNGYADAASGYEYILREHGRLSGVGFDRVMDHFAEWVTIPEREGLAAGSHNLPARAALGDKQ